MSKRRKIEVFTAGCPVCEQTINDVNTLACPDCDVTVYDLNKGCDTNECRQKAKLYGIRSVPAVVIDGQLAECCVRGGVDIEVLRQLGLGQPI